MFPWQYQRACRVFFRLLQYLIPLIPEHRTYVEVFGGAASLLLNKPSSKVEVYNDIDSELVNLFMTVRDHPTEFIRHVQSLPYSRALHDSWRNQLYREKLPGDRFERAVRFYYLLRSSFFGHVDKGWRFALKTDEAARLYNCVGEVEQIAQRLTRVHIDCKPFQRCIRSYDDPEVFMYCDPPYYGATAYRRGLPPFTETTHEELARLLREAKAKWMLTYNPIFLVHSHIFSNNEVLGRRTQTLAPSPPLREVPHRRSKRHLPHSTKRGGAHES